MKLAYLDDRRAEVAVGLILVAIAAIVTREAIVLGPGWGSSGPRAGFFPFLSAAVMGVGALVVVARALRAPAARPVFANRMDALAVLKVGAPLAAAVASIAYLGFYVMTALYMGVCARWYGRYRWYVVLAAALVLPVAVYFGFERGLRVSLPKSIGYVVFSF